MKNYLMFRIKSTAMKRIGVGSVVRTSYNTGPYRVVSFVEGCTCPNFIDSLNLGDNAPLSKPHYHLMCRKVGEDKSRNCFYYLNGYDENLNSVWDNDRLIVCHEETTLLALCCNNRLIL